MKMDENYLDRIDAYLDNRMSQQERQDFEEEIKKDDLLAKEVQLQKDIRKALHTRGKQDLKNELNTYYREYKSQKNKKRMLRILVPVFSAAASLLLLIYIFSDNAGKPDNEDRFITLDTAGINQPPEYADSAVYRDSLKKQVDDTLKMN